MWALPTAYFLSQVRVYISSFSFFVFFDGELRRRGNYLEYCYGVYAVRTYIPQLEYLVRDERWYYISSIVEFTYGNLLDKEEGSD